MTIPWGNHVGKIGHEAVLLEISIKKTFSLKFESWL